MPFEVGLFGYDLDPIIKAVADIRIVVGILVIGSALVAILAIRRSVKKVEVPQAEPEAKLPTADEWLAQKLGQKEESQPAEKVEPSQLIKEPEPIPNGHSRLSIALEDLIVRGLQGAEVRVSFTKTVPIFLKGDQLTAKLDDGQIGELTIEEAKKEVPPSDLAKRIVDEVEKRMDARDAEEKAKSQEEPSPPAPMGSE